MAQPITAATALVGVLGDPVRHSLSPVMHNAALAALGLDWVYLALPAPADRLAAAVEGLAALGCRGLNVTIPHKQAVAALCRELSPLAERLGAVNTLVPLAGGGWRGTNTDVEGFLAPLRTGGGTATWSGRQAVVLGCGGSARAVVAALVELGMDAITVSGRRAEAVAGFVASCRAWAPQLRGLDWQELDGALGQAALLVNTTPVGMAASSDPGAAERCPLSATQLDALPSGATVYDLIYTPRPTALLRAAAARGCPVLDGLEMLVQQGAASLRLWSGRPDVPVEAMRAAAAAALGS
ncbi:shikimate dehydrogenase [Cyanobium sp. CH-040]|uniref:shikimate dehydrogenase n=1 Tax=Cyanobium sp. CH-040 TaxID=2823708 RepID=UPI0020CFC47E|nr:shikimate dehydrogenase [Cyanobium sp. CH-040]MCP9927067.1 shikimate dehydrogenase [Cyanobium sp. CH-040]